MKLFFGYVRVSTAKQGEKGVSLQEQRDAIQRYSDVHDLKVVQWFEERETAAKKGRRVFGEMLRRLRHGQAEGVVIHKIDRSARNLRDWATLGDLIDEGVDVRFVSESLDLNSRGGRLSADIQAVVAADYIRNLREETRKGFYGRLKQGFYPLPAPVGYVDNGAGKAKTPCPIMAPLVRAAFELYATGQYTLETLGPEMYRLGLRNRRGSAVSHNGLSTMLNNPFYIGLIHLGSTGETFSGAHEPLVSKSVFDAVQAVLQGRFSPKTSCYEFVFRRMLRCHYCNYSLIGERHKGHVYYRCHSKDHPVTSVREEAVEQAIEDSLRPIKFNTEEMEYLQAEIIQMKTDLESEQERQTIALKLSLSAITDRLARLTDAYLDGTIEKELFEERKKALMTERLEIQEKLSCLESEPEDGPTRLQTFLELVNSAQLTYKMGLPQEKRDLLATATSNRTVAGKNVMVELTLPFKEVATRPKFTNGGPYRDTARTFLAKLSEILTRFPLRFPGVLRGSSEDKESNVA